jgi:membrane-associated protease RseP (regulator of RpoE activity)
VMVAPDLDSIPSWHFLPLNFCSVFGSSGSLRNLSEPVCVLAVRCCSCYLARVNTLRIGNVFAPSVVAHVTTDPLDKSELAGNIGQSILGKFTEVFDCMRGKIYSEKAKNSDRPEVFNGAGLIFDSFGHGLQVMTVLPGGPGAKAGLQIGDVITAINGEQPSDEVNSPPFLQPPGTELRITVQHGSETREVSLTLKEIL